jgi:hypothetical protein
MATAIGRRSAISVRIANHRRGGVDRQITTSDGSEPARALRSGVVFGIRRLARVVGMLRIAGISGSQRLPKQCGFERESGGRAPQFGVLGKKGVQFVRRLYFVQLGRRQVSGIRIGNRIPAS